jgi:predicted CXXCH cytochrome family protein
MARHLSAALLLAVAAMLLWPLITPTHAQSTTAAIPPAPSVVPVAPDQPIPFSHKIHSGDQKMACITCHKQTRSGENLLLPQAQFCMTCHTTVAADKPAIQKLAQYASSGDPIQWVRVYDLPSFVTFSHSTHMSANVTCTECHGPVETREAVAREIEWNMPRCFSCHQKTKAATACDTCHAVRN